MSGTRYRPEIETGAVSVAGDLLEGQTTVSAYRPLTCRWPRDRAPEGFVVFCHGLGSNGGEYEMLSSHWAAHGYLVIHPTFSDSIDVVMRTEPDLAASSPAELSRWIVVPELRMRMHEILHTPARWMERVDVVEAVMDSLEAIFANTCGPQSRPLRGAIAGHSFGAYTTQLLAGAEIDMPGRPSARFRDRRFSAAIVLSGQGRDQQGLRDGSWDGMDGPVLTVTGTRDRGAKGGDWRWKSEPFELAPAGGKYLAVLEDGDHYLGGLTRRDPQSHVPAQQEAVKDVTLAFLDAFLRDSRAARDWLGQIEDRVGDCPLLFRRK